MSRDRNNKRYKEVKKILLVSIGFSPNIGGVETHLDDLILEINKRNISVSVLTYTPLTTNIKAPLFEKRENCEIIRIPIIRGLFYKLTNTPILEFLYLLPGLFLALPVFLLLNLKSIRVIHSHGLVAGFVSVFWGFVFNLPVITTTHSVYTFPAKGLYRWFSRFIFDSSDKVLCLSQQSAQEVERLGVDKNKIQVFTYWINVDLFKPIKLAKEKTGWDKFTVLFVGRLVEEKGLKVLLSSKKDWDKSINLVIIGTGPLQKLVERQSVKDKNLLYLGIIPQEKLPLYYSAADLLIVPSIHEEGFGRVILESLSCGTPVVGARRGAIPEVLSDKVGELIDISKKSIKNKVEELFKDRAKIDNYKINARSFALKRFTRENSRKIIDLYFNLSGGSLCI